MADVKISALTALTGANTAADDVYVVVDTNVPETKKQTRAELFKNVPDMVTAGTFVHNEAGADKDARFEGDTDVNLLVTDASTDRVGIGTATPTAKLQVNGSFALNAPVTVTTNYTVAADANFIISNRGATNTLTLPDPATNTGRVLYVTNIGGNFAVNSASSNVVPRAGGGAGTAIIPATNGDGAWVMLVCDGTNWLIAAGALGIS
jgi:hypothetical protein